MSEQFSMTGKFVETPYGRLWYWLSRPGQTLDEYGGKAPENNETGATSAPALVFLHGLTADHRLFRFQYPKFADDYVVLGWDAPGHGLSRPYTSMAYADAAAGLKQIIDAEGLGRVVLIGQSMGGFQAQEFIDRYPDVVAGFFGIDTCPYGSEYYSNSDLFWLRQMGWMTRCYPEDLLKREMAKACAKTDAASKNMERMLRRYGKDELCRLIGSGYREFVISHRNIQMSCPATIVCGAQDKLGKVLAYCEAWHEKEGIPYHVVEGASHNANDDAPDAVNALLADFIARTHEKTEAGNLS